MYLSDFIKSPLNLIRQNVEGPQRIAKFTGEKPPELPPPTIFQTVANVLNIFNPSISQKPTGNSNYKIT